MNGNLVSSAWLKANINDPNLVILDASQETAPTGEVNLTYIPHSIAFYLTTFSDNTSPFPNTLPSAAIFEKEVSALGINNSSKIVVYDSKGIYNSPRVWWLFRSMGHQNIAILNGGLPDWINNGFETVSTPQNAQVKPSNFTANFNPNLVRSFTEITHNLATQEELVIDARSSGRFNALVPEPRKELRGGHIPNSVNIPFEQVLENGFLKSDEELTQLFNAFDLANKTLVFTCGSGITACVIYLAAEQISTNPKAIYDGSWTEWAQLSDV